MSIGKAVHRSIHRVASMSKSVSVMTHALEGVVAIGVAGGVRYVEIAASGVLGIALFTLVVIEIVSEEEGA